MSDIQTVTNFPKLVYNFIRGSQDVDEVTRKKFHDEHLAETALAFQLTSEGLPPEAVVEVLRVVTAERGWSDAIFAQFLIECRLMEVWHVLRDDMKAAEGQVVPIPAHAKGLPMSVRYALHLNMIHNRRDLVEVLMEAIELGHSPEAVMETTRKAYAEEFTSIEGHMIELSLENECELIAKWLAQQKAAGEEEDDEEEDDEDDGG